MEIKIYFDDKPLILTTEMTDALSHMSKQKRVFIERQVNEVVIRKAISQIKAHTFDGGILLGPNPAEILMMIQKVLFAIEAAGGLIYGQNGHILLIFRRGKWDLPKGKLDEGENLSDCALREVKEETGLSRVEILHRLGTTYHTYLQDGKMILKASHWFAMKGDMEEPTVPQTDEDIEDCKWVAIENLGSYLENAHASIKDVVLEGLKDKVPHPFSGK